jgi:hypothetical protein
VDALPDERFTASDAQLSAHAVRLIDLALLAVQEHPFEGLRATLRQSVLGLDGFGVAAAGSAAALARREEYLSDAADLLRQALTRLGVALAAPAESDLSVHLARARDAVAYLAEITADLLPDRLCAVVGTELAAGSGRRRSVQVLERLRAACDLAEIVVTRAAEALTASTLPPSCAGAAVASPPSLRDRRAEIDGLLATLTAVQ